MGEINRGRMQRRTNGGYVGWRIRAAMAVLFVTRGFVTLDEFSLVGRKMLGAPKGCIQIKWAMSFGAIIDNKVNFTPIIEAWKAGTSG